MTLRQLLLAILNDTELSLDTKVVFDPGEATKVADNDELPETGVVLPDGPIEIGHIDVNNDGELVLTAAE